MSVEPIITDYIRTQGSMLHVKTHISNYKHLNHPHSHKFFEFELLTRGTCTQIINGRAYECVPGHVIITSPLDVHEFTYDGEIETVCISFTDDLVDNSIWKELDIKNAPFISFFEGELYNLLLSEIEFLKHEINMDELCKDSMACGALNRIIVYVLRNVLPNKSSGETHESYMKSALSYIRYNFKEKITLNETARFLHVSPNHFCKYFHKKVGVPFQEYLLTLRLKYACNLLQTSDKSITEICLESGFSSPAYFSRAFKKHFGKTPSAFKSLTKSDNV